MTYKYFSVVETIHIFRHQEKEEKGASVEITDFLSRHLPSQQQQHDKSKGGWLWVLKERHAQYIVIELGHQNKGEVVKVK